MSWLYRLQQRAGLTGPEGTAAVVLVLALAGGLGLRGWQTEQVPVAAEFYAAADAAFVAASQGPDQPDGGSPVLLASAARPAEGSVADVTSAVPAESDAGGHDHAAESVAGDGDVRTVAETAVRASSERSRAGKPPPVRTNINTASAEQLQRLPRIGPALAQRIVEHRHTHGRFGSAEGITEVKGIGERTLERLRPWIFV